MDLKALVKEVGMAGIEGYDLRVQRSSGGYHLEVELDNMLDPTGAVTLGQCEEFSRRFSEMLDGILSGEKPEFRATLPPDLTPENYSMEVSSAGAERKLRIPEDLERFKGRALKIRFQDDEKGVTVTRGVYNRTERSPGEGGASGERVEYIFDPYEPTRKGKQHRRAGHGAGKTRGKGELRVVAANIIQVNLYLDF